MSMTPDARFSFRPGAGVGWGAALLEIEHQAEHWDTPAHGDLGRLIAEALRAAVAIARTGGLRCDHRLAPEPGPQPEGLAPGSGKRTPAGRRQRLAEPPSSRAG